MLGRLSRLFTTPTVNATALVSVADIHFYGAYCLTPQIRSRWHSRLQQHAVGSYTATWQEYCERVSNFQETNSRWVLKWREWEQRTDSCLHSDQRLFFINALSVYFSSSWNEWCGVSTRLPSLIRMIDLVPKDEQVLIDHLPGDSDSKYFFIICHIRLLKKHVLQTLHFLATWGQQK